MQIIGNSSPLYQMLPFVRDREAKEKDRKEKKRKERKKTKKEKENGA